MNKMIKIKYILLAINCCLGIVNVSAQAEYVNPMIGTNGMGHTFPGACAPFGIVQLSPDTDTLSHNIDGVYNKNVYAYCAGYQYSDKTIVGFSHTHLSGTGHSDLGDLLVMPATGELKLNPGRAENPDEGYRSRFMHNTEVARPGYYEVMLDDYQIKAQLTATPRTGVHKYTFPEACKNGRIILDLIHGIYNYDGKVLWSSVRVENDTLLTGYRITNGWARTNYTYFAISFSKPMKNYGYEDREKVQYNGFWRRFNLNRNFPEMAGRKVVSYFEFDFSNDASLEVKVALSGVSTEGALKNLQVETGGKNFDQIASETYKAWNHELSTIKVEGTEDQKTMFYTSYYHTMINPSVYTDVDGYYRGLDNNIHRAEDFTNYTIFSLWDTYRAEHPFLNLMKADKNRDMVISMIRHQQQSVHGMLPIWSHMANENWCMSGYHAVSALADAIVKSADVDRREALKAMVKTSKVPYYDGMDDYMWLHYVPFDHSSTSASTTLEYAYDDWCIYQVAQLCGEKQIAEEYRSRALNYRNLFDRSIGFIRPKYANGAFKQEFDPLQTHGEGFIEGNSWNFSFHAPHDVNGLITLMGGDKNFVKRLDDLFSMELPAKYYEKNEDITKECLLGGYVHGNEPSHHVPYLYAWTSQPWKTQYWVREIMNRMYKNDIKGLSGNDDCGQMSAWYIFTSLGFYPVCPGTNEYVLGAPYMPYQELALPNGNKFVIKAPGVSDKKRYVRTVKLNGKLYPKMYITHEDIMAGGELEFVMSATPNKSRGKQLSEKPYSLTDGKIEDRLSAWKDYNIGEIEFFDKSPETKGSAIYKKIVPDPEAYIADKARKVLATLYFSPEDSIVPVRKLDYSVEKVNGVSAKGGGNGEISIWYSTDHIEKSFVNNDTARLDYETRGVLFHELTHAYQLEPQGIGTYGTNKTFWAFIEGMADACRVVNGCFTADDRPRGGTYMDGYRTTGFFLAWLQNTKDPDFIRKFNQSALKVVPWSFDGAIKYVLGNEYSVDDLWNEYQKEVGDK